MHEIDFTIDYKKEITNKSPKDGVSQKGKGGIRGQGGSKQPPIFKIGNK